MVKIISIIEAYKSCIIIILYSTLDNDIRITRKNILLNKFTQISNNGFGNMAHTSNWSQTSRLSIKPQIRFVFTAEKLLDYDPIDLCLYSHLGFIRIHYGTWCHLRGSRRISLWYLGSINDLIRADRRNHEPRKCSLYCKWNL